MGYFDTKGRYKEIVVCGYDDEGPCRAVDEIDGYASEGYFSGPGMWGYDNSGCCQEEDWNSYTDDSSGAK